MEQDQKQKRTKSDKAQVVEGSSSSAQDASDGTCAIM